MSIPLRPAALGLTALALGLALSVAAVAAQEAPPPTSGFSDAARRTIEEAIDAMGGREHLAARAAISARLSMTTPATAVPVEFEIASISPETLYVRQPLPQLGLELTMVRNGEVAWARVPMQGVQAIPLSQIEPMAMITQLHRVLLTLEHEWTGAEMTGESDCAGEPCVGIRFTDRINPRPGVPGDPVIARFSRRTGRLIMIERPDTAGRMTQVFVNEYKPVGDVTLYHRIEVRNSNGQPVQTLVFLELRFGEIDPKLFEIPESLRTAPAPPAAAPPDAAPPAGGESGGA